MAPNILKSSLENASFNIIFQILCRCVTFVLNAFVVRHVGQAVLGVMNVRLLLLESMILFLSREPFMKACLTNTAEHNWAQVVNLLWVTLVLYSKLTVIVIKRFGLKISKKWSSPFMNLLVESPKTLFDNFLLFFSVPICVLMSLLFGYTWLFILLPSETLPPYYTFAVLAVAVSCIIELSSLIVQLVASAFLFVRLKVILDTIMIAIRTLTFVPLILYQPENALFAFGVAQLVAAIFYTISHYAYFHFYITKLNMSKDKQKFSVRDGGDESVTTEFPFKSIRDFLPGQLDNSGSLLDKKLSILTWSFFRQGVLKQILTEGERLIMTIMPILTFAEQGTYEIVNNLGSLAARFIFRPIEDSGYFYFTQMVKRDKPIADQNVVKVQESVTVLMQLCSVVTSIGLVVLVFGQSYSSLLLFLYGGSKLTTYLPVLLLRSHCLAVLLLGINGVTECYTNATADSRTIDRNNYIMIYESVAFLVVSYFLVSWLGPVGFIFGNCVNMALRILHSTRFIKRRHEDTKYTPLLGLVPKPMFVGCLILAAIVTKASQAYFFPDEKLIHLIIGIIMFSLVMASWFYEHQDLIQLGMNKWRDRRNKHRKSD